MGGSFRHKSFPPRRMLSSHLKDLICSKCHMPLPSPSFPPIHAHSLLGPNFNCCGWGSREMAERRECFKCTGVVGLLELLADERLNRNWGCWNGCSLEFGFIRSLFINFSGARVHLIQANFLSDL